MSFRIVTDIHGTEMIEPDPSFFLNPPPFAAVRFTLAQRGKSDLYLKLPKRECVFYTTSMVQEVATALRLLHPDIAKDVTRPNFWSDLYRWFDHAELWEYGAQNMVRNL